MVKMLSDGSVPREHRVNVSKRVNELDIADWALVNRAFEAWPFKPLVRFHFPLLVLRHSIDVVAPT